MGRIWGEKGTQYAEKHMMNPVSRERGLGELKSISLERRGGMRLPGHQVFTAQLLGTASLL
jgi:hypothetical protein